MRLLAYNPKHASIDQSEGVSARFNSDPESQIQPAVLFRGDFASSPDEATSADTAPDTAKIEAYPSLVTNRDDCAGAQLEVSSMHIIWVLDMKYCLYTLHSESALTKMVLAAQGTKYTRLRFSEWKA